MTVRRDSAQAIDRAARTLESGTVVKPSATSLSTSIADVRAMTDEQLEAADAFGRSLETERRAESSSDEWIAHVRLMPDHYAMTAVQTVDQRGDLCALALCTAMSIDSDRHLLHVRGGVAPDHRRRGLGRHLLASAVDIAHEHDRSSIVFKTRRDVAGGEAWAAAVGAIAVQREQTNRLDLHAVDRAPLEQWVREGPQRAADYELVTIDGACPEELLSGLCDVYEVMNDAPQGDLDRGEVRISPEQMRQEQAHAVAMGVQLWTVLVRHRPTGELVAFHDAHLMPAGTSVGVGQTGVKRAHRGHAIGKWMKASMTLRILDEHSEVTEIRTTNASTNEAMLGINRAMGYQVERVLTTWQLPVSP